MVGHVMNITYVGHCLQKMLLFAFKGHRFLLMIKRSLTLLPTMFWMESIAVVLVSLNLS